MPEATAADLLREARSVLAFQTALAGPLLFRSGTPDAAPTPVATAPTPTTSAAPTVEAARPLEPPPVDAAPTPAMPAPSVATATAAADLFGAPAPAVPASPYDRVAALIPPGSPLHALTSLEEVGAWVANTVLTDIDRTRIKPVLGVGDPHAAVMVVGEAPGADEDREGEPFVGRAGQLLNKILEAIQFRREDVYICNILKSRPPNNRDPLPHEVEAHIPILYKQIALVQPKLLLCVGKQAGNGLLGKQASLASLRGRFHDFHGLPLLVTYHPAALLRNPEWKRPTWEDVQFLRARYDTLMQP